MSFILSLLLFVSWAESNDSAFSFERAARQDQILWQKLLHVKNDESLVASDFFFLSKEKTLAAEWEATLTAFKENGEHKGFVTQPARCAFVARRKFFERLGLVKVEHTECEEYDAWKKGMDAKGIALVFSSSYPNNPASHFGHTFLRVRKERLNNDLLDYAISYSAVVDGNDPGFIYAIKGIAGGYFGRFDFSPYYTMVGIYNNNESRDLLEYELDFKEEELERLMNHVWELYSNATFAYYFFDENCSSVLGRLLEVARPNWDLKTNDSWYYLPSELVRRVVDEAGREKMNLLKKARPSLKEVAKLRLKQAAGADQNSAPVLDAKLAQMQYLKFKRKNNLSEEEKRDMSQTLIARAKLKNAKTPPLEYRPSYPEESHLSKAVGLTYQQSSGNKEIVLNIKQGHHDLYNNDLGYVPYSQFDFLDIAALYHFERQKIRLDRLRLIDIYSAHPLESMDPQVSWLVRAGRERAFEKRDDIDYRHEITAAMGASFLLGPHLTSFMLGINAEESSASYKRGGIGPHAEWVNIIKIDENFKIGLEGHLNSGLGGSFRESLRYSLIAKMAMNLTRDFDLRLLSRYDRGALKRGNINYALETSLRF